MIVRDEERFLRGCLESARGLTDEIVVVDTGSRDLTVSIAREFGARVLEFTWADDFAAARNRALAAASGQWMLVLDADERLDAETAPRIRQAALWGGFDAGYLRFLNMAESGSTGQEWLAPRLYRRRPGLRWVGRIHEQVVCDAGEVRSLEVGATVYHYGYQAAVYAQRQKRERAARLLEKALEDPEAQDPLLKANYLFHHANQADGEELLRRYERFEAFVRETWPQGPPRAPWITGGLAEYARLLADAGRFPQARDLAEELLERNGESPMLRYVAARSLAAAADLDGAERHLEWVLRTAPPLSTDHRQYPQDVGLARGRASFLLGLIREKQGRLEEAVQYYQLAVNEEPQEDVLRASLACGLARLGRYSQALETLEASMMLVGELRPGTDCLGFVLALLAQSPGKMLWWGDKVRRLAESFPPAAALLERVIQAKPERAYQLQDFPEIASSLALSPEPGAFSLPQTVRRAMRAPV